MYKPIDAVFKFMVKKWSEVAYGYLNSIRILFEAEPLMSLEGDGGGGGSAVSGGGGSRDSGADGAGHECAQIPINDAFVWGAERGNESLTELANSLPDVTRTRLCTDGVLTLTYTFLSGALGPRENLEILPSSSSSSSSSSSFPHTTAAATTAYPTVECSSQPPPHQTENSRRPPAAAAVAVATAGASPQQVARLVSSVALDSIKVAKSPELPGDSEVGEVAVVDDAPQLAADGVVVAIGVQGGRGQGQERNAVCTAGVASRQQLPLPPSPAAGKTIEKARRSDIVDVPKPFAPESMVSQRPPPRLEICGPAKHLRAQIPREMPTGSSSPCAAEPSAEKQHGGQHPPKPPVAAVSAAANFWRGPSPPEAGCERSPGGTASGDLPVNGASEENNTMLGRAAKGVFFSSMHTAAVASGIGEGQTFAAASDPPLPPPPASCSATGSSAASSGPGETSSKSHISTVGKERPTASNPTTIRAARQSSAPTAQTHAQESVHSDPLLGLGSMLEERDREGDTSRIDGRGDEDGAGGALMGEETCMALFGGTGAAVELMIETPPRPYPALDRPENGVEGSTKSVLPPSSSSLLPTLDIHDDTGEETIDVEAESPSSNPPATLVQQQQEMQISLRSCSHNQPGTAGEEGAEIANAARCQRRTQNGFEREEMGSVGLHGGGTAVHEDDDRPGNRSKSATASDGKMVISTPITSSPSASVLSPPKGPMTLSTAAQSTPPELDNGRARSSEAAESGPGRTLLSCEPPKGVTETSPPPETSARFSVQQDTGEGVAATAVAGMSNVEREAPPNYYDTTTTSQVVPSESRSPVTATGAGASILDHGDGERKRKTCLHGGGGEPAAIGSTGGGQSRRPEKRFTDFSTKTLEVSAPVAACEVLGDQSDIPQMLGAVTAGSASKRRRGAAVLAAVDATSGSITKQVATQGSASAGVRPHVRMQEQSRVTAVAACGAPPTPRHFAFASASTPKEKTVNRGADAENAAMVTGDDTDEGSTEPPPPQECQSPEPAPLPLAAPVCTRTGTRRSPRLSLGFHHEDAEQQAAQSPVRSYPSSSRMKSPLQPETTTPTKTTLNLADLPEPAPVAEIQTGGYSDTWTSFPSCFWEATNHGRIRDEGSHEEGSGVSGDVDSGGGKDGDVCHEGPVTRWLGIRGAGADPSLQGLPSTSFLALGLLRGTGTGSVHGQAVAAHDINTTASCCSSGEPNNIAGSRLGENSASVRDAADAGAIGVAISTEEDKSLPTLIRLGRSMTKGIAVAQKHDGNNAEQVLTEAEMNYDKKGSEQDAKAAGLAATAAAATAAPRGSLFAAVAAAACGRVGATAAAFNEPTKANVAGDGHTAKRHIDDKTNNTEGDGTNRSTTPPTIGVAGGAGASAGSRAIVVGRPKKRTKKGRIAPTLVAKLLPTAGDSGAVRANTSTAFLKSAVRRLTCPK